MSARVARVDYASSQRSSAPQLSLVSQPKVQVLSATDQRRSRVLALTGPIHSKREHDLRNFLYLITSFTQLLSDGLAGGVTERQKEFLSHVLDCAGKMRQLLDTSQA